MGINTTLLWSLILGAVFGIGIFLLVREFFPSHPQLSSALQRLHRNRIGRAALMESAIAGVGSSRRENFEHTIGNWLADRLSNGLGLKMPRKDLSIIGQTPEAFMFTKVVGALAGIIIPSAFMGFLSLIGLGVNIAVPLIVSIVLGILFFIVPDVSVRRKAERAREEFRRTMCAYLDLVALQRAADAGAGQALTRPAALGQGWAFERIREVLERARLVALPPWDGLQELAEELSLNELTDLGDIMRQAGDDGASIYKTLIARSRSLRTSILTSQQAQANSDSEKMVVPSAILALALLGLVGYPAFARILFG